MKISDIRIDTEKTFGNHFWLVSVAPAYEYKNGVKTDILSGYKCNVVLPEHGFEKMTVKVPSDPMIGEISGYAECKFTGLEAGIYSMGKEFGITAKADTVEILAKKA